MSLVFDKWNRQVRCRKASRELSNNECDICWHTIIKNDIYIRVKLYNVKYYHYECYPWTKPQFLSRNKKHAEL